MICMRRGKNLMLDISKSQPNFTAEYTNDTSFKADLVFNYTEWRKQENFINFVREEERQADSENSEEGFELHSDYMLTIVSTADDEQVIS